MSNPASNPATASDLDQMFASATPIDQLTANAGRPRGEVMAEIARRNMKVELAKHHGHADKIQVIPCRQRSTDGTTGIRTSAGHNAIYFYLVRCPVCPETVASGPHKGQKRAYTVFAAGQGELNRYLIGDGTPKASVTSPFKDPKVLTDSSDASDWTARLEEYGISQTRIG